MRAKARRKDLFTNILLGIAVTALLLFTAQVIIILSIKH